MILRVHDRCNRRHFVLVLGKSAWGSSPLLSGLTAVTKDMSQVTNPKIKERRENYYVWAVFLNTATHMK